jgi:hypothetical protein
MQVLACTEDETNEQSKDTDVSTSDHYQMSLKPYARERLVRYT